MSSNRKITVFDDGKGKEQSWEAWCEDSGFGWKFSAVGRGPNEEAANGELIKQLALVIVNVWEAGTSGKGE